MKNINLIPKPRREADAVRQRWHTWAGVCAVYALAVAACVGGAHLAWGGSARVPADAMAKAQRQIGGLNAEIMRAEARLAEIAGRHRTARTVADHPDFGALLALLSRKLGDDVVLGSVRIDCGSGAGDVQPAGLTAPGSPSGASAARTVEHRLRAQLQGHARSQAAVSALVMTLQESRVFDEVKLVRAAREPFLSGQAVAFQVSIEMNETRSAE